MGFGGGGGQVSRSAGRSVGTPPTRARHARTHAPVDDADGVDVLDPAEELVEEELDVLGAERPPVVDGAVQVHVHQLAHLDGLGVGWFIRFIGVGGWMKWKHCVGCRCHGRPTVVVVEARGSECECGAYMDGRHA